MGVPGKFGLLLLCAVAASPQQIVSLQSGLIHFVYGRATLDGRPVRTLEDNFPQMKTGQALLTEGGRAEVLLSPSAILRLSENGALRMVDTSLANALVNLEAGTALIEILKLPNDHRIRVAIADTVTELHRSGLYRLDSGAMTLSVYRGEAEVRLGKKTVKAKRGKRVQLGEGLSVSKFDTDQTDTLHRWAARRSLLLALTTRETRKASRWSYMGMGWLWNADYGLSLRSNRAIGPRQSAFNPTFRVGQR